jgi:hypothetical protein
LQILGGTEGTSHNLLLEASVGDVRHDCQLCELFETPHDAPPQHALMITAYLDESEHSDSSKYTVVAGFRGKKEQWDEFIPLWRQGLGNRTHLHMNSLRWNHQNAERRIKPLLDRLGPIPYQCGLVPIYSAVKAGDYADLVQGLPKLEDFGGYLLSMAHLFTLLLETISPTERIKIICEQQDEYEPPVNALFNIFQKQAKTGRLLPQLAGIEFLPKDSSPLFEPSDYLSFSIGKESSELGGKKDLWSRAIRDSCPQYPFQPGVWLSREVARQTIMEIKNGNL